jgi:hypothetical protein
MAIGVLQERHGVSTELGDYVFPNTLNERKDARILLDAFYTAMRRAGIEDFRFHDLLSSAAENKANIIGIN